MVGKQMVLHATADNRTTVSAWQFVFASMLVGSNGGHCFTYYCQMLCRVEESSKARSFLKALHSVKTVPECFYTLFIT